MMRSDVGLIFAREWLIIRRSPWLFLRSVLFLATSLLVAPLCLGGSPEILSTNGVSLTWIILVFVNFVAAENLFDDDYHHGVLDQMIMRGDFLPAVWLLRALRHWFLSGGIVLAGSPFWSAAFCVHFDRLGPLALALACGSLNLSLIMTFCATLTLANRKISMPIFAIPLMVPTLILGTSATHSHHASSAVLWLIAMFFCLALILSLAGSHSLRSHAEYR